MLSGLFKTDYQYSSSCIQISEVKSCCKSSICESEKDICCDKENDPILPDEQFVYKCHYCPKAYVNMTDFKKHLCFHPEQQPYLCNICYNTFTKEKYLKMHMNFHSKERPFKCHICNSFSAISLSNLKKHINIVHAKSR